MTAFRLLCALLVKDLYIFKRHIFDAFLDGIFIVAAQWCVIGLLYPRLGIAHELIVPLYVGSCFLILLNQGFMLACETVTDLHTTRIIDYYLTLPCSTKFLCARFILFWSLRIIMIGVPLIGLGLCMLSTVSPLSFGALALYCILFCFTAIIVAAWFLAASFWYSYDWFLSHVWPRRLYPLMHLSSMLFPLATLETVCPTLALIARYHPVTYIIELWRAALQDANTPLAIDPYVSIGIYLVLGVSGFWCAWYSMLARLDPVDQKGTP